MPADERGKGDKADAAAAGVFAVGVAESAGGGVGLGEQGEAEGDVAFAEAGLGRQGWGDRLRNPRTTRKQRELSGPRNTQ